MAGRLYLTRLRNVLYYRTFGVKRLDAKLRRLSLRAGPALVVGSAPAGSPPSDFGSHWSVVTANASQTRTEPWGIEAPALTVFRGALASVDDAHASGVWDQLTGRSTAQLLLVSSADKAAKWNDTLSRHNYSVRGNIVMIGLPEKSAVLHAVSGYLTWREQKDRLVSQGVLAAMLALYLGAKPVVMTGFSLSQQEVFYGAPGAYRTHVSGDRACLEGARKRGWPLFAADESFAAESGLPLWQPAAGVASPDTSPRVPGLLSPGAPDASNPQPQGDNSTGNGR